MKLQAVEKAVVKARGRTSVLQVKTQELERVARTAKDDARKAKAKLKLAKQEAKRSRRAAKSAKRSFNAALLASETATRELALLESKLKKGRKKAQVKNEQPRPVVASNSPARSSKPVTAKSALKPTAPAAPLPVADLKPVQPVASRSQPGIHVPREFEVTPGVPSAATATKGHASAPSGRNPSR